MPRLISTSLLSILLFSTCAAAQTQAPATPPQATSQPSAPPAEEVKPDAAATAAGDATAAPKPHSMPEGAPDKTAYVIGPEDSLYIRVWHEPDLSGTLDVRPDGYISMQLIGELKADGMTVSQLAAAITKRLTEFIKTPEVNVQLLKVNSKKFSIQGEVNRPGTYALTGPTTLLEALVNASGFRDFANTKKIYVLRGNQRFSFNYKMVSKGKNMDENILIQNGDQIFVP